jgi:hypothetical protein
MFDILEEDEESISSPAPNLTSPGSPMRYLLYTTIEPLKT